MSSVLGFFPNSTLLIH